MEKELKVSGKKKKKNRFAIRYTTLTITFVRMMMMHAMDKWKSDSFFFRSLRICKRITRRNWCVRLPFGFNVNAHAYRNSHSGMA